MQMKFDFSDLDEKPSKPLVEEAIGSPYIRNHECFVAYVPPEILLYKKPYEGFTVLRDPTGARPPMVEKVTLN